MLVLTILLDFSLNFSHKSNRFSEILLEKNYKFVTSRRDGTIIFYLGPVLLLAEVNPISEKLGHKKYILGACNIGRVKIVLLLLIKIVVLYIEVIIVQVKVPGLKSTISKDGVYFAIFLALNK